MIHVSIPEDVQRRLQSLSDATGRSPDHHVQEALLEYLSEQEAIRIAEDRLQALKEGATTATPLEQVLAQHGLAD